MNTGRVERSTLRKVYEIQHSTEREISREENRILLKTDAFGSQTKLYLFSYFVYEYMCVDRCTVKEHKQYYGHSSSHFAILASGETTYRKCTTEKMYQKEHHNFLKSKFYLRRILNITFKYTFLHPHMYVFICICIDLCTRGILFKILKAFINKLAFTNISTTFIFVFYL